MNVNFWKVDVHINWTIVYIEMVLLVNHSIGCIDGLASIFIYTVFKIRVE